MLAQPDRQGGRIEHGAEALHLLAQLVGIGGQRRHLAALARERAEAQRGEAAGGAAIGLEQFARAGADADVEGLSRGAQLGHALGQCRSRIAVEPGSEIEQRLGGLGNFGGPMHGAADAFGRAVAAAPDDEHMGLGRNGGLRLVQLGFEFGDAVPGRHVVARHAADDEERPDDHRQHRQDRTRDERVLRDRVNDSGAHSVSGQSPRLAAESGRLLPPERYS